MLYLTLTTDKVDLISGSAANLDVVVAAIDLTGSPLAGTPVKQLTNIQTATTTDILAAPGASTYRTVKTINVRNKHATQSCDVTVRHNANGTAYELHKATLDPGECLEYVEGIGWFLIETPAADAFTRVKLTSDASAFTTTTVADITGMSLPVLNGKYYRFMFIVMYRAAATTTGIKLALTIPAVTQFSASVFTPVSTLAGGTANIFADWITASAGAVTGTGTPATTANYTATVEGLIVPSADGNIQLQGASEVAASNVTVKQGTIGVSELFG